MIWTNFPLFASITAICWIVGLLIILIIRKNKIFEIIGNSIIFAGIAALSFFVTILWINLERPPLRTLGETRLWYSIFMSLIGMVVYLRWKNKWHWILNKIFLALFIFMACLFLYINYIHPENYDKTLMPALQSPWFVPHVIVYIFAYVMLGLSFLVAIIGLYMHYTKKYEETVLKLADNLVYIGFAFLTFGLLFGALWAKEAWGHYWTWDPKETWALITWLMYLLYMHFRHHQSKKVVVPLWMLSLSLIILLIAWFGINYLPSAQNSVHVYGG